MTETMKNLTNETADSAGEGVARVATNGQAADDGKPIIRICDLHKNYDDLVVLRGVDLEVKRGEVVVILGPSGSGKSTLLRCVNLLEQPTGGQVFFEDTEITAKGTDINAVRAKVGMVFLILTDLCIAEIRFAAAHFRQPRRIKHFFCRKKCIDRSDNDKYTAGCSHKS